MKKNERKYGFTCGKLYSAVVTKIENDRIFFEMENWEHDIFTAAYFITGGNINPFQIFKIGQEIKVRVISLCNQAKNNYGITMLVVPNELPVDRFIHKHPLGSTVLGTIHAINGPTVVIMLAPNVYCVTKRCKHAKTGMRVPCKIHNYRVSQKTLSIVISA